MSILRRIRLPLERTHFISFVTGAESGIATSAAIIIGLIVEKFDNAAVIEVAMLAILVQAFNSSLTRYSSIKTEEEIESAHPKERLAVQNAVFSFIAHMLGSFILFTAFVAASTALNILFVGVIAISAIIILATWKATVLKQPMLKSIVNITLTSSLIMLFGLAVGFLISQN